MKPQMPNEIIIDEETIEWIVSFFGLLAVIVLLVLSGMWWGGWGVAVVVGTLFSTILFS